MNRREFLKKTAIGALALGVTNKLDAFDNGSAFSGGRRPNVLIILIDDMGYGDLSCHGNPVFKTPNLDKLHSQSIRFTQYHAAPMCTPTRGQLMTGVHTMRNGARHVGRDLTQLRTDLPTMAEIFSSAGYATAIFGKWHLGDNYPYRPQDRGFQEVVTFPLQEIGSPGDYWGNDYFDDTYQHNGKYENYKGYCNDVWFQLAANWMKRMSDQRKPFLCYLPTNVVHGPYYVEQQFRDRVTVVNLPKSIESYFGMLINFDDNIGRIMRFLEENRLDDNTIVIFMSDNGGSGGVNTYNAGMRGWKGKLWEGGHRAPLFIRWPNGNLIPPIDIDGLAYTPDILPTLLDLCDLKPPKNARFDGISLGPYLRNKYRMPNRKLVIQMQGGVQPQKWNACIMWGPWRLLHNRDISETQIKLELYNIEEDPHQDNDVYDQYPHIVAEMKDFYEKWWAETEKTFYIPRAIIIGNDAENPSRLCATSWADTYVTQLTDILEGRKCNGYWQLMVDRAGNYEFALRRWPEETKIAIRAKADIKLTDPYAYGPIREGTALSIASARIKIDTFDKTIPVTPDDTAAVFNIKLNPGRTQLKTWFYDENGNELCGAYYVTVTRK